MSLHALVDLPGWPGRLQADGTLQHLGRLPDVHRHPGAAASTWRGAPGRAEAPGRGAPGPDPAARARSLPAVLLVQLVQGPLAAGALLASTVAEATTINKIDNFANSDLTTTSSAKGSSPC